MPSKKGKGVNTATARPQVQSKHEEPVSFFPFARYTSVVGVHTSLLAFTALLLPSTSPSLLGVLGRWDFSSSAEERPQRDTMKTLTENPVRTVAWICAGAFVLQSWWASWVKKWSVEARKQKVDSVEETKQKLERKGWGIQKQRATAYGQAAAATLAASVIFYAVAVLCGAPLSSHLLHTFLMSLLLATLAVFPPAYTLGIPSVGSDSSSLVIKLTWVRLFAELSPRTPIERALVYPAIGAVLGCWAGAIPILLDWERPWQAWPLTSTFGAVGGCIIGSLVALVVSVTFELAQVDRLTQQTQAQTGKVKKS